LQPKPSEDDAKPHIVVRLVRRVFHATDYYDGDKLFTMHEGRRALTPMLLVMLAIGGTDILFALDSIPAIFGLTQDVFIVFTATAFSLLGLRQLYFLVDGLLERLVYLSWGLAAILAFIGVKLILHALHENNLPFVNDGEPVKVIEIGIGMSLGVIAGVLLVTVVASLLSARGKAQAAVSALRRHATTYLGLGASAELTDCEKVHARVVAAEQRVAVLDPKYRELIHDPEHLREMVAEVHRQYAECIGRARAAL
jgi:tellurite resistance protein TerC